MSVNIQIRINNIIVKILNVQEESIFERISSIGKIGISQLNHITTQTFKWIPSLTNFGVPKEILEVLIKTSKWSKETYDDL